MGPSSRRKRANWVHRHSVGSCPATPDAYAYKQSSGPASSGFLASGLRSGGGTMGVKIAVVGGGSTYTPELIEGFATRPDRLPIDELVLLDIDPSRLEVVGGLARRMLDRLGWGGRLVTTQDREAAIDGANYVVIQLRVGGQAARLVDETLPRKFGTIS